MSTDTETRHQEARRALEKLRMRLLDLTAHNRLINFHHSSKQCLRIVDELPNPLSEALLNEQEMRFNAVAEATEKQLQAAGYLRFDEDNQQLVKLRNPPSAEEWAAEQGLATDYEIPQVDAGEQPAAKHQDKTIQTLHYPDELENRLKSLRQTAESAIQETGANMLYLAFGFLEWYDQADSDQPRLAPLFLLPVRLQQGRLNKHSATYEYTLSYSGEDIITNLSLREKLRIDFSLALPELDEHTAAEDYFQAVQQLINQHQPRWRVRRHITLALLNFSKLLMYQDLDPGNWPDESLINHTVVSRFLSGYQAEQAADTDDALNFSEEYAIDEQVDIHQRYPLISNADSSQHSALIDALNGKNLVIEGPPGTGKSQTISNLIAAAMAQGKKVLFVAEKLAALEVVHRRLESNGLGDFCLELHSHKSQKHKMLDEIGNRLAHHGRYQAPEQLHTEIEHYEQLKQQLQQHVSQLNRYWKSTGLTLHQILSAATRYRLQLNGTALVSPEGYHGDNYDSRIRNTHQDLLSRFAAQYHAISQSQNQQPLTQHPWYGVTNGELQLFDHPKVNQTLEDWQHSLQQLSLQRQQLAAPLSCSADALAGDTEQLQQLADQLQSLPPLQGDEVLTALPALQGETLQQSKLYLQLLEYIEDLYRNLKTHISTDLLDNFEALKEIQQASLVLQQLMDAQTTIVQLSQSINQLSELEQQLTVLQQPLQDIQHTLGDAGSSLNCSQDGLGEYQQLISLVTSLKPSGWKHRASRFDDPILDELLPTLSEEVSWLREQHQQLSNTFALNRLPDLEHLRSLQRKLQSAGLLKWLNPGWWDARAQALGLATHDQVTLEQMQQQFHLLLEYLERYQQLTKHSEYQEALGEYLQGHHTDIEMLSMLRDWYRRLRQQYGSGFGPKVAIGNAVLALTPEQAQAIRSLDEQGLTQQLNTLQAELLQIRPLLATDNPLQQNATPLCGEQGQLAGLLEQLRQAVKICRPILANPSIGIGQLVERMAQIDILRDKLRLWHNMPLDQQLFNKQLQLDTGPLVDNQAGLARLRHTLQLADAINEKITHPAMQDYLHQLTQAEAFQQLQQQLQKLQATLAQQRLRFESFGELVKLQFTQWTAHSGHQLSELIKRNQQAIQRTETLANWLDYLRVAQQLAAQGLDKLVQALTDRQLDISQLEDGYKAGIYDLLAREIMQQQPELATFSGISQQALQQRFCDYDSRLQQLQCQQLSWQIDQVNIPQGIQGGKVSEHTECALLQHECNKKSRHLPIRQLLKRAGNALAAIKPCFMMGPMSVAQYLAPGQLQFDLIIMDEASQIKPQDALGAIARGQQLVVVGDPKQLPPTRFFDRNNDDAEEEISAIEESESILDATLPIFPARRLRWHYRSQHESLISFSNQAFYDSDLILFPSPYHRSPDYGLQYHRVAAGCFVNRRNPAEAERIAQAICEHLRRSPDETLGVVAMSVEQRQQIERTLEALSKQDRTLQHWLEQDAQRQEALFIKNLENVQGDERDVILISMTYGPAEAGGKVAQRFGPINSNTGWRRLNVLLTRARKRMHIFSSMDSRDIQAGNSSKRGLIALHDFLAYCEHGTLPLQRNTQTTPQTDSDFSHAVIQQLQQHGFECRSRLGISGLFIDVAVIDPDNPGNYLLGIECDGPSYQQSRSSRDRDHLRPAILQRLGWNMHRIWSADWYKNPQGEIDAILHKLHAPPPPQLTP